MLRAVLLGKNDPPFPAQLVQPRDDGVKLFLIDEAAAAALLGSDDFPKTESPGNPSGATRGKMGKGS